MKTPIFLMLGMVMFLAGCSSKSKKYEQQAFDCWAAEWLNTTGKPSEKMTEGLNALDQYLADKGFLKGHTPNDYFNFANDTQQVVIPTTTPGFEKIKLFLEGANPGAADAEILMACFKDNITAHMSELDSADVMFRFGSFVLAMENSGSLATMFNFYKTLSQPEMDHPFIKTFFYMSVGATGYPTPKICLGQRIKHDATRITLPKPAHDTIE